MNLKLNKLIFIALVVLILAGFSAGQDIDTPDDFRIAELIVNTGFFTT